MSPNIGTVLVTGGAGFLGAHVVEAFASDTSCQQVVATYRQHKPTQISHHGVAYHVCDFSSRDAIAKLLKEADPDIIVHTIFPGAFAPRDIQYRVNYESTKHLLELALHHSKVRVFIYASTAEAVGLHSGFNTRPETEEEAVLCTLESGPNWYARTKGAADALALASNHRERVSTRDYRGFLLTTCLRFPGIYGPKDKMITGNFYSLVNSPATRIQLGPNKAKHDWVFVDSAARAHVLAAKALIEGPRRDESMVVDGEAFFITDGKPTRLWDFTRLIWAEAGDCHWAGQAKVRRIIIPWWFIWLYVTLTGWVLTIVTIGLKQPQFSWRTFDYMRKGCWFSIEKARKRLGYEPVCDTEEGVRRAVEWFREYGHEKEYSKIQTTKY
jgi:sterol-4alpha-carboxylate 3-dehydrogenase (decarboxylating)